MLDCRGLAPPAPDCAPSVGDAVTALVRAASGFTISGTRCTLLGLENTPGATAIEQAAQAVHNAATHDWSGRQVAERVAGQNSALRIAFCFGGEAATGLRHAALSLVHRMALPRSDLVALGTDPDAGIRAWLGDPSRWQDLKSHNAIPFHEQGYGRTKAIRAMIVDDMLVNLGQLVAVDTEWQPHITPFVGSLEIRRPIHSARTILCAASMDIGWLRCGAPAGIRPFTEENESVTVTEPFMFRTDSSRRECGGCHLGGGEPKAEETSSAAAQKDVAARRAALLRDVADQIKVLLHGGRAPGPDP